MTKTQDRVAKVLERIAAACARDEDEAEMFSVMLQANLSELNGEDAFGSEGENDPRGDFRDGSWGMDHVQGVDG